MLVMIGTAMKKTFEQLRGCVQPIRLLTLGPVGAVLLLSGCALTTNVSLQGKSAYDFPFTSFDEATISRSKIAESRGAPLNNKGTLANVSAESRASSLYQQGRTAFDSGALDLAMSRFKQALKLDLTSIDARNGLAAVLFELGRYEEAYDAIQVAQRMSPNDLVVARNFQKIARFINADFVVPESIAFEPVASRSGASNSGASNSGASDTGIAPAELASIDRPPSVVDLGRVQGLEPLAQSIGNRMIEITPITLSMGYARVLPATELTQLAPNVYTLSQVLRIALAPMLKQESLQPVIKERFARSALLLSRKKATRSARVALATSSQGTEIALR